MQTFRSLADLAAADLSPPIQKPVASALSTLIASHSSNGRNYAPEDDGFVLLVEPGDTPEAIRNTLGYLPHCIPWEGSYRDGPCLVGILLRNNQFALSVVVLDGEGIDASLRESLRACLT